MLNVEDHIDNLVRHIELVQQGCLLLGKRLIDSGKSEFGRILIAHGFCHDNSKFYGVEWDYLHAGNDVPKDELNVAIKQHSLTNCHHPEHWGDINEMPSIYLAECVVDWYARAQEFGTGLREWIKEKAISKYNISELTLKEINGYVDMLLQNSFVQESNQ